MLRARFLLGLFAGIAAIGCAINPATGGNQLMLVSESQEIQMGQQYDSQVVATIGVYPDPVWQRYIQQFGARLAATTERPNLPWTFRVVDDPAVNAFALPGGFVYAMTTPHEPLPPKLADLELYRDETYDVGAGPHRLLAFIRR